MGRAKALALFVAVASGAAACGLNQEGVRPPRGTLFYPASAVVDTAGRWLFVSNSNADLRYNDGTVVAMNLGAQVSDPDSTEQPTIFGAGEDRAGTWDDCPQGDYVKTRRPTDDATPSHYCCRDRLDPAILNCDERAYIASRRTIRVGSFVAGMLAQQPKCPDPKTCQCNDPVAPAAPYPPRLYIAVRGNTSITWADVVGTNPPRLDCNPSSAAEAFTECDADHRVVDTHNLPGPSFPTEPDRPRTRLPDEPYALALDEKAGLLYVGHLTGNAAQPYTGGFSLFDVAPTGDAFPGPRFVNPFPSPFPANNNGSVGITSLMWNEQRGAVYATSRYVPAVTGLGTLIAEAVCGVGGTRDLPAYPNGESYDTMLVGSETRGIQFIGDHAFVLQRTPPVLVEFDANRNPITTLETCSGPTFLYSHYVPGRGDRLFVNCFDTGELYVINPVATHLERTFQIGRGPAGLVFPASDPTIAYVVGFGDNNISVIDLDPTSLTEYRVIQRIGFPSTVPR